ncbi:putative DNA-directed RNA polymerase subunit beta' C terminal domain (rpoC2) [Candidatus Zinderia insecticola CARI]|uniref:DNA-directed RNA polymerase n=1 Tax=Zinderia insecticola (strain CARI) TaxID=871271 RepID=E0TIP8_ZINIC|nr:putative DNA-directed RNA polymerase subunit beta' C terminal domain (rpoC2) [Candidatus Zinderia insecticola CARI]
MIYEIFPKKISFNKINKYINKSRILKLINLICNKYNTDVAVNFSEKILRKGLYFSTKSGISISIEDAIIPKKKKKIILKGYKKIKNFKNKILNFPIIKKNKNININIWEKIDNKLEDLVLKVIYPKNSILNKINSIFFMLKSGARGSINQIKQLSGMRGLMIKANGNIIKNPITSNFREGLNMFQYFISTHGSRKGLSDTALKTANSGYLTRKLVDVSQDIVVREKDCGSNKGVVITNIIQDNEIIENIENRVFGRITSKKILDRKKKNIICKKNTIIDLNLFKIIKKEKIIKIEVRSPLKCKTYNGICSYCYGYDLSKRRLVSIGTTVGIIAAQSIGEPGTQLTMRTFHTGGIMSNIKTKLKSSIFCKYKGIVKFSKNLICVLKNKKIIVISKKSKIFILNSIKFILEEYELPLNCNLRVKNNSYIKSGKKLFSWNYSSNKIISKHSGIIKFKNFKKNKNYKKIINKITNEYVIIIKNKSIINYNKYIPKIKILYLNKNKLLYKKSTIKLNINNTILNVYNKQKISSGKTLAYIPKEKKSIKDIMGGLPRISELFEVIKPKNRSLISEIKGILKISKKVKNKIYITIKNKIEKRKYIINIKKKKLLFGNNEIINKGDFITSGNIYTPDILKNLGIKKLVFYIMNEIQNIYRTQGVKINDKHIEIILKQMLSKVEITKTKNFTYFKGEIENLNKILKINRKLILKKKKPIKYRNLLLGITKISLLKKSFMSSASFQETSKILTKASLFDKKDKLKGLKENIMIGKLLPAGTGNIINNYFKK